MVDIHDRSMSMVEMAMVMVGVEQIKDSNMIQ